MKQTFIATFSFEAKQESRISDMLIRLMGSVEEVKDDLNILFSHEYLEICVLTLFLYFAYF